MYPLLMKQTRRQDTFFFQSSICNIHLFFIDKILSFPDSIYIYTKYDKIIVNGNNNELCFVLPKDIYFFIQNQKLLVSISEQKNKKRILHLFSTIVKTNIKGVLQGYKLTLLLKGIGLKAFCEKTIIRLKIGLSHTVSVSVPPQINVFSQTNKLIFSSPDWQQLTQYVHQIKHYKKPEPYKGKGFCLKNEILFQKEGKKSKK